MANSEEKISKFVQAITSYAEEQRDKIHREAEDFKSQRLLKAEQDVLADVYQLIQKENSSIRSEGIREISRRDLAERKKRWNIAARSWTRYSPAQRRKSPPLP